MAWQNAVLRATINLQHSEAAGAFRNWHWSRPSRDDLLHKDCTFLPGASSTMEIPSFQYYISIMLRIGIILDSLKPTFSLKPVLQMSSLPVATCRTCSATLTMVICSVASMICLIQGMLLFGDARAQRPLALVGMTINLMGGIWYTMSQVGADAPEQVKSANEDTEDSCSNRYS